MTVRSSSSLSAVMIITYHDSCTFYTTNDYDYTRQVLEMAQQTQTFKDDPLNL